MTEASDLSGLTAKRSLNTCPRLVMKHRTELLAAFGLCGATGSVRAGKASAQTMSRPPPSWRRDNRGGALSSGAKPQEIQHNRRIARDVVPTALQVHDRDLGVSGKGLQVGPGHRNFPDQRPPTIRSAGQCGEIGPILLEGKSVEFWVAARKYVDRWI